MRPEQRRTGRGALLALTTCALLAPATWAQNGRVTLTVKPVLCITEQRNESCEISVLIAWRSDNAGTFCLHSDFAVEPITCWQLAASGQVAEDRVIEQTFSYWLTDGVSETRLAEAKLELMTTESDDRRRNRRRRHVWDIL